MKLAAILGELVMLTSCVSVPASPAQSFVGVYPAGEFGPNEPLSLEIGDTAWRIEEGNGGGVVTPILETPATVVLFAVQSCRVLASFEANPGSAHRIRISDNSVEVEDAAGTALEMGPGLVEDQPSGCTAAGD